MNEKEGRVRIVDFAGRGIGAASGAIVAMLWILGVWMPASGLALTGINFVVALLMALLALFAAIASVRGHPAVLLVVFVASFFPVGVTLIEADHWLRWAGALNVCYLVAAVLIRLGQRRNKLAAARDPAARS